MTQINIAKAGIEENILTDPGETIKVLQAHKETQYMTNVPEENNVTYEQTI